MSITELSNNTDQTQSQTPRNVVIVGAGITGLAAAHRVQELAAEAGQDVRITVLESDDRIGGNIHTVFRDGFLIEGGPDSFITQKPAGLALCKRLGIDGELIQTNPECRRTLIERGGKLHALPDGFLMLAPTQFLPFVTSRLFSWPGKIRMGMDLFLPRKDHGTEGDESLADFVRRRFGQEALDRIAQPLVGGIYTADPEVLSLRATMPRFLEMEAKYRSLILGMRAGAKAMKASKQDSGARYSLFVSFPKGAAYLTDTIASRLPEGAIRLNTLVKNITRSDNNWQVETSNGETINADGVILATPAHISADMLRPSDATLADDLNTVDYASSVTVSLAFKSEQVKRKLDGFGFVVPAAEKRSLIASTFSSIKFAGRAPEGWLLMRAFCGGAMFPEIIGLDDAELQRRIMADLRELIDLEGEPAFTEIHRWPRSMPQYPVGHLDRVKIIKERLAKMPGLQLAGNAFGGVGIPDCVESGEKAAAGVAASLGITAQHTGR